MLRAGAAAALARGDALERRSLERLAKPIAHQIDRRAQVFGGAVAAGAAGAAGPSSQRVELGQVVAIAVLFGLGALGLRAMRELPRFEQAIGGALATVGLLIVAVLAFNFMGDGIRDAADPYL